MGGGNRIPPRGPSNEIESGKFLESQNSGEGRRPLELSETSPRETLLGQDVLLNQARFGEGKELRPSVEREFIDFQRIAGADGMATRSTRQPWVEFASYLRDLNLFGSRVHRIDFRKAGSRFTIGSKPAKDRNYRNLSGNNSAKEQELYGVRDGMLHLRSRVEDLAIRGPQFLNLFDNLNIRPEAAVLEEKDGVLLLRNLSRDPLLWTLQKVPGSAGKEWVFVPSSREVALEDGAIILFGKLPSGSYEMDLEPSEQTVLRVERHRDSPKDPYRWNLIEFTRLEPARIDKIQDPNEYLATLLGQSPEWTRWRFKDLLSTLQEVAWGQDSARALLSSVIGQDPQQAELRLARLPQVLRMANCIGMAPRLLLEAMFSGPILRRFGMALLERLPKYLEALSQLGFSPEQSIAVLERLSRYEPDFFLGLDLAPEILRQWRENSGNEASFEHLLGFLDRTQLAMSALRGFLGGVPGAWGVFFRAMTGVLPELRERWGMGANLATRMGLELLDGPVNFDAGQMNRPEYWLSQAVEVLPLALEVMFGLGFGFLEARAGLRMSYRERGPVFASWWRDFYRTSLAERESSRRMLESLVGLESEPEP